jgi:hypothetical protein
MNVLKEERFPDEHSTDQQGTPLPMTLRPRTLYCRRRALRSYMKPIPFSEMLAQVGRRAVRLPAF